MKRITILFTLLCLGPALSAQEPLTWDDYLGKWDLTLANSKSSFRACSLVLQGKPGAHSGELVWRWGSAWQFEGSDVASLEKDGTLVLRKKEFTEPLRLKIHGHGIEGEVLEGKNRFYVVGQRAVWQANPAGDWKIEIIDREGQSHHGSLHVQEIAPGQYRGHGLNGDGDRVGVDSIEVKANRLTLRVLMPRSDGSETPVHLAAEIRGDRLVGRLMPPGDEGESIPFTAKREREWSEPIRLFPESGTAGWHPRDRSRAFKWTCENGVLSNGDHDVDIVSEAKFRDFKLNIRYKVDKPGSNSGIYLRGRYEVQVIGNDRLGKHGNGAVYSRLVPSSNPFSGAGKWQELEITFIDRYLTVVLNGVTIHDNVHVPGITGGALRAEEHLPGPFVLQGDHGRIHYRDAVVRVPR